MLGWLFLALLLLRVVAVSHRGGGFMAGCLFGNVQGHGGRVHALYGQPQRHENKN